MKSYCKHIVYNLYDTAANSMDRSFLKALGVTDMSTTPFLSKSAFDARMAIYKDVAFSDYISNDTIRFIKEARDIILQAVIKSIKVCMLRVFDCK